MDYRIARIPKGRGNFREVYIASKDDQRRLRKLLPELESILADSDTCNANYAFERDKNCALSALQHVGYRYTLSMDLADFFNQVTINHVSGVIPRRIIDECFIGGNPKQGLPTSPLISTIAFLPCDKQITETLKNLNIAAVYTRYADDLVFSFNNRDAASVITFVVQKVVEGFGFKVNERKTVLQNAQNGRVIVNGLAVDAQGIHATRRTKKKIRAAIHQGNTESARGLLEWSRCKLPARHSLRFREPRRNLRSEDSASPNRHLADPTSGKAASSRSILNLELVLFDLDNTLLQTDDLERFRGSRNVNVNSAGYKSALLSEATSLERTIIPEGVIKSVRLAARGGRIGVFTTSPRSYANTLLTHYYPNTTWDAIVAFEDVRDTKPHSEGILLACKKLVVRDLRQVILVGDSWKDIASAYRAGCWSMLFKHSWPNSKKDWGSSEYRAINYLPDAIVESPNKIEKVLADLPAYLPALEMFDNFCGTPPKGVAPRIEIINHFNNFDEKGEYVPVLTLGRMFPNRPEIEGRQSWHDITRQIYRHKDAREFPGVWVRAVSCVITQIVGSYLFFERAKKLLVAVVPHKPGRPPRLENFLAQLAKCHIQNPIYEDAEINFVPDVLEYKDGARSHHGEHLSAQLRFENVRDNLFVSMPDVVKGKHILVIDDVVTSGATMYYANKYLRAEGAAKVTCLALTQTVRP